jgi:hypothetical protein
MLFVIFLESGGGSRLTLSEFSIEMVRVFIVCQQERGISPYTVQGKEGNGFAHSSLSTSYESCFAVRREIGNCHLSAPHFVPSPER